MLDDGGVNRVASFHHSSSNLTTSMRLVMVVHDDNDGGRVGAMKTMDPMNKTYMMKMVDVSDNGGDSVRCMFLKVGMRV